MKPDCERGNHTACPRYGWNLERDEPDDCPCPCHQPTDCPSCADLRAEVAHWQGMARMYLAAAKASIAAKAPDAARSPDGQIRPALPPVAGAEPADVRREGQPDLRAADGRTA